MALTGSSRAAARYQFKVKFRVVLHLSVSFLNDKAGGNCAIKSSEWMWLYVSVVQFVVITLKSVCGKQTDGTERCCKQSVGRKTEQSENKKSVSYIRLSDVRYTHPGNDTCT